MATGTAEWRFRFARTQHCLEDGDGRVSCIFFILFAGIKKNNKILKLIKSEEKTGKTQMQHCRIHGIFFPFFPPPACGSPRLFCFFFHGAISFFLLYVFF
jgi:hypothetical protein